MNNPPVLISPANPYGTDLWVGPNAAGVMDLDPGGRTVTGRQILSQRLVCRQTTPRATVIDAPNECFDIRGWLSQGLTATQIQQIAGNIKSELMRDEGVQSATVQVTYDPKANRLTVIENIQSGYGPFQLTTTVSQLTIQVLVADQGT